MDFRQPGRASAHEPAINLPAPIVVSILVLLAIQAFRGFASDETDLRFVLEFAFIPAQWSIAFGATPDEVVAAAAAGTESADQARVLAALARYVAGDGVRPWSWVSYALLHGSWMHVGLNCVWLAAFGAPVLRRAGLARCAILSLAAAAAGAGAQWLAAPLAVQPMIGASAVVSGIMAAAATFVFRTPDGSGRSGYGFLGNRNALFFLAAWFAVNILFGLLAGPLGMVEGQVAWQAHIGGLVAGLALFPLLDRMGRGQHPDIRRT